MGEGWNCGDFGLPDIKGLPPSHDPETNSPAVAAAVAAAAAEELPDESLSLPFPLLPFLLLLLTTFGLVEPSLTTSLRLPCPVGRLIPSIDASAEDEPPPVSKKDPVEACLPPPVPELDHMDEGGACMAFPLPAGAPLLLLLPASATFLLNPPP